MIELLKRNLLNQQTQYTNAAAELVKEHYRFTSKATVFEPSELNDKQASSLLSDDNFTFGNVTTRDGPFCNELILALFLKIWFRDHRSAGVLHPDVFFPVKIVTLSFVVTLLEKSISEWVGGFYKQIKLCVGFHKARVEHFSLVIKKYRDFPDAQEIYDNLMTNLENSARNKARQVAPTLIGDDEKGDNSSSSSDEVPMGGLKVSDIERAILQRRLKREGQTAQGESPMANLLTAPTPHEPTAVSNNNPHITPNSFNPTNLKHFDEFGLPDDNEVWALSSLGSTQSSFSTIFPADSVSQQIPKLPTNPNIVQPGYTAACNNQTGGFLELMRDPVM
ncbi:hypothetical protein FRC12_014340 [Ceratobasidium sp. 428]|nr:hypothetical protein FRC12_014340 [Ceratobasidium sp. 428]